LKVGTKTDIHNNGLFSNSKSKSFYLEVGRIIGNFHFPLFQWELWGLISPVRKGAIFLGGEQMGQHSAMDRTRGIAVWI